MAEEIKPTPEVIDEACRATLKTMHPKLIDYTARVDLLLTKYEQAKEEVKALKEDLAKATMEKLCSDKLDILYTALSTAKKDMAGKVPERNAQGQRDTGNKSYAKVDAMRSFVDEHIAPHGLAFTMDPVTKNGIDYLLCTLSHTSGQFKSWYKETRTYTEVGWQAYAKALTYDKRLIYGAVFGIDTGSVSDEQEIEKEEKEQSRLEQALKQTQAVQPVKKPFNPHLT